MNRIASTVGVLAFACLTACGVKDQAAHEAGAESEARAISATEAKDCSRSGCSGQICSDTSVITTCEWLPEYACYDAAKCERQADGACGWTQDEALTACLGQHADGGFVIVEPDAGTAPEPEPECVVSGCSGQICSDTSVFTTCEWLPEYGCYAKAKCERQADGVCGWTQDDALTDCLASP